MMFVFAAWAGISKRGCGSAHKLCRDWCRQWLSNCCDFIPSHVAKSKGRLLCETDGSKFSRGELRAALRMGRNKEEVVRACIYPSASNWAVSGTHNSPVSTLKPRRSRSDYYVDRVDSCSEYASMSHYECCTRSAPSSEDSVRGGRSKISERSLRLIMIHGGRTR